jgi:hypothetical protein
LATVRVSVEAKGARAVDAATHVATYVALIEGATPYVRPPEHFITPMMPAPCMETAGSPPAFSVFINITERPSDLLVSLLALRINANSYGITSCVAHEVMATRPESLRELCKNFVRLLADNPGGIRWQHQFDQVFRDLIDP